MRNLLFFVIALLTLSSPTFSIADSIKGKSVFCYKEKNNDCNTIGFYFKTKNKAKPYLLDKDPF